MVEDFDTRDDKHTRLLDRAALGTTLLYSFGLGLLGFVIIAVGIVGAFQH
jgi:hypothetical protein